MVSCFLTPSTQQQYTFPPTLRREVEQVVGEYLFDCPEFRTADRDDLVKQIYTMTERRFDLADHLLRTKPWELFAMVEMGTDRMHHAFWKDMDAEHRKHEPGGAYETTIREYYRYVDERVGRLLEHADDETVVLVVSDHGAKRMDGGIRVNEWLRSEGWLATRSEPAQRCALADVGVDWSKTKAWGDGGYYGRVFLNVRGREPEGVIDPADYERVRDELAAALAAIPDEQGRPIGTRVFKPDVVYPRVEGVAPDLIVHFGDLYWRSVGTIGGDEGIHTFDNDTGPDDANHAQHGVLMMSGPGIERQRRDDMHLLDVAPTVLDLLGVAVPAGMRGRSLVAEEAAVAAGV
jgi:predicted AlkP superfamily phosphohydrolase/phosphomutase